MEHKTCSRCNILKPVSEYYKDKRKKDGLYSHCKTCHNKTTGEYYSKNKKYYKEYYKVEAPIWREKNRERYNKYQREYYNNVRKLKNKVKEA